MGFTFAYSAWYSSQFCQFAEFPTKDLRAYSIFCIAALGAVSVVCDVLVLYAKSVD